MVKIFQHIYYGYYRWSTKVNPEHEAHQLAAVIMFAVASAPYGYTLLLLLETKWGMSSGIFNLSLIGTAGLFLAFCIIVYSLFVDRDRFDRIKNAFDKESASRKRGWTILTIIYTFGGFAFFFLVISS